jgi:hypothetical protein
VNIAAPRTAKEFARASSRPLPRWSALPSTSRTTNLTPDDARHGQRVLARCEEAPADLLGCAGTIRTGSTSIMLPAGHLVRSRAACTSAREPGILPDHIGLRGMSGYVTSAPVVRLRRTKSSIAAACDGAGMSPVTRSTLPLGAERARRPRRTLSMNEPFETTILPVPHRPTRPGPRRMARRPRPPRSVSEVVAVRRRPRPPSDLPAIGSSPLKRHSGSMTVPSPPASTTALTITHAPSVTVTPTSSERATAPHSPCSRATRTACPAASAVSKTPKAAEPLPAIAVRRALLRRC